MKLIKEATEILERHQHQDPFEVEFKLNTSKAERALLKARQIAARNEKMAQNLLERSRFFSEKFSNLED
jgi:1,2-phenylacetyl-CoA epoxidase PaaB subunit